MKSSDIYTLEILKSMLSFGNSDSLLEIDGGVLLDGICISKSSGLHNSSVFIRLKKIFYNLIPYFSYPKLYKVHFR